MRKTRLDLGLLQKDVARIIGVTTDSVTNWEKNRSSPSPRFIPRITRFLGYVPYDTSTLAFGERIVFMRRLCGVSQKELAHRLEVDPTTLARWERGKSRPVGTHMERLETIFNASPVGAGWDCVPFR